VLTAECFGDDVARSPPDHDPPDHDPLVLTGGGATTVRGGV
jgi:hypothetical protein